MPPSQEKRNYEQQGNQPKNYNNPKTYTKRMEEEVGKEIRNDRVVTTYSLHNIAARKTIRD